MRIAGIDLFTALALLAATASASCSASGAGLPSATQAEADGDCPEGQAVARGSTRYVYQGTGRPALEDSSETTNLGGPAPGPVYAGRGAPPPSPQAPARTAQRKPGC